MNQVAIISSRAMATFQAPEGYEFERQVTRTVLSQKDLDGKTPIYVEFESVFKESDKMASTDMPPPFLADIVNLQTGELQYLIGNAVLMSELDRAYPDGGYVGKGFGILKIGRAGNKADRRYNVYRIVELKKVAGQVVSAGKGVIDATDQAAVDRAKEAKKR